jgi:hypothetical protein
MNEHDDTLERLIDDLARGQPLRRAPADLEARVLRLVARKSAWWKSGFDHWPMYARGLFILASVGIVRFTIGGVSWVTERLGADGFGGASLLHQGTHAAATTLSVTDAVVQAIPAEWLYGAAAVAFVVYAWLFGLGAVAYRTLYVQR